MYMDASISDVVCYSLLTVFVSSLRVFFLPYSLLGSSRQWSCRHSRDPHC